MGSSCGASLKYSAKRNNEGRIKQRRGTKSNNKGKPQRKQEKELIRLSEGGSMRRCHISHVCLQETRVDVGTIDDHSNQIPEGRRLHRVFDTPLSKLALFMCVKLFCLTNRTLS
jgi:hypothetical protein